MKTHIAKRPAGRRWIPGFSLPEVTLAVGVASVALMSVVGLLPILLSSDQDNGANTSLTTLATQTLGRISSDRAELAVGALRPTEYKYYFSQEGEILATANNLNDPGVAYACRAKLEPVTGIAANPGDHVRMVHMEFTYNGASRTTKTFHASLNDEN